MSFFNIKKITTPHHPLNSNLVSDPSHNHIIVTLYKLIHKNITKNIKKKLKFHNKIKLINIHRSHSLTCIYQKQINKIDISQQN